MALRISVALLVFCFCAPAAGPPWPTYEWPVSTPEAQGLDPETLAAGDRFIRANVPTLYSLLVVRNGYLVFERYYNGRHANSAETIASVSKSWISAMIGILADEGRLSLDETLDAFFPECFAWYTDPRKREIRVRHLLTMTAGFDWDDYPQLETMTRARDWIQNAIDTPMAAAPGEKFAYNTALTHMLSAVISRRSGTSAYNFAWQRLFAPMGIYNIRWPRDPQGYYLGGWEMYMSARDLARFGLLYLRDGMWDGRRLLPAAWVAESLTTKVNNNAAERRSANNIVSNNGDYGYLWWIKRMNGRHAPFASGYGGQTVFVIPELDMVVVTTADATVPRVNALRIHDRAVEVTWDYVMKSVKVVRPGVSAVLHAACGRQPAAPGSFISIYGRDFAAETMAWDGAIGEDGALPAGLAGVRVRAAGRDCHVSYVSPGQVNALLPEDLPPGEVEIEVENRQGSARAPLVVEAVAPAFVLWQVDGRLLPAAVFDGEDAAVAPEGALAGLPSRPARPGDVVRIAASGLGPAAPHAAGFRLSAPCPLLDPSRVRLRIGGAAAEVRAAALVDPGRYEIAVKVPAGLGEGWQPVALELDGKDAQSGVAMPVRQ